MSKMKKGTTYKQLCRSGKVTPSPASIEFFLDGWFLDDGDGRDLVDALGFTPEQYAAYLTEPHTLPAIVGKTQEPKIW